MRYDAFASLLHALAAKLTTDGVADAGRARAKLASALHAAGASLSSAATHVDLAWSISAPHM